jgi:hypothetical protein
MHALRPVLVTLALIIGLAGCGDDSADDEGGGTSSSRDADTTDEPAGESASAVTHTFEGNAFTCEEALDINPEVGCPEDVVDVWEEFGQNLPDFVDSGRLGPLNDESFAVGDVAFAGVMACVISFGGGDEQDFIDYIQDPDNETQLEELSGTELLPAWFEAPKSLCTDAGRSSGDHVTP